MTYELQLPVRYALHWPPTVQFLSRPKNQPAIRAADSTIFIAPNTNNPRTTRDTTHLARVLLQAYGDVKLGFRAVVSGPLNDAALIDEWDRGTRALYNVIREQIFNETYSTSNFIHKWVDGVASAEGIRVLDTNMDIEARILLKMSKSPDTARGEAEELEAAAQDMKIQMSCLDEKLRSEYEKRHTENSAIATSTIATALKKKRAEQIAASDAQNKDQPLTSFYPESYFTGLEEVYELRDDMVEHLARRHEGARWSFWASKLSNDMLASHIERGCDIVDIKSFKTLKKIQR